MSMERLQNFQEKVSQGIHDKSMQTVEWAAGTSPAKRLIRETSHILIERGKRLFKYNNLQGSIEGAKPFLKDNGKLVIIAPHKSHGDIAPAVHIMEEFIEKSEGLIEEFSMPVAASMAGGQQGNIIKTLHDEGLAPNMNPRKIDAFPVVTDNDIKKRGLKQNKMTNGLAVVRRLGKDSNGFFIFIEGTVQGGRKNPETGAINGLQEPDSMLEQMIGYSRKVSQPLVFVMAGISNSHKLFSADGKFFTPEWVRAMALNAFDPKATFAEVNMSDPIVIEPCDERPVPVIAFDLMADLAQTIPFEERGIWKNPDYLFRT